MKTELEAIEARDAKHNPEWSCWNIFERTAMQDRRYLLSLVRSLSEALRWYGPPGDFDLSSYIENVTEDQGDLARKALARLSAPAQEEQSRG
jgi:hypothetical protein